MGNLSNVSQLFRRKILHVDDYAANIELVKLIIERRQDLQLLTATTGAQCVELACDHLPAVILMETVMRDMKGVDVLQRLREIEATANIPVIAFSASALPVQINAAMDAGFYRYLTKPFKIPDLMQAIDDALLCAAQRSEAFAA